MDNLVDLRYPGIFSAAQLTLELAHLRKGYCKKRIIPLLLDVMDMAYLKLSKSKSALQNKIGGCGQNGAERNEVESSRRDRPIKQYGLRTDDRHKISKQKWI